MRNKKLQDWILAYLSKRNDGRASVNLLRVEYRAEKGDLIPITDLYHQCELLWDMGFVRIGEIDHGIASDQSPIRITVKGYDYVI